MLNSSVCCALSSLPHPVEISQIIRIPAGTRLHPSQTLVFIFSFIDCSRRAAPPPPDSARAKEGKARQTSL